MIDRYNMQGSPVDVGRAVQGSLCLVSMSWGAVGSVGFASTFLLKLYLPIISSYHIHIISLILCVMV
jgi:hypothetical protein